MSPDERLVYMANQIARNLAIRGADSASLALADHIAAFWEPRMRERILAMHEDRFEPIARRGIEILRNGRVPPPQSHATQFGSAAEGGGSDAG